MFKKVVFPFLFVIIAMITMIIILLCLTQSAEAETTVTAVSGYGSNGLPVIRITGQVDSGQEDVWATASSVNSSYSVSFMYVAGSPDHPTYVGTVLQGYYTEIRYPYRFELLEWNRTYTFSFWGGSYGSGPDWSVRFATVVVRTPPPPSYEGLSADLSVDKERIPVGDPVAFSVTITNSLGTTRTFGGRIALWGTGWNGEIFSIVKSADTWHWIQCRSYMCNFYWWGKVPAKGEASYVFVIFGGEAPGTALSTRSFFLGEEIQKNVFFYEPQIVFLPLVIR